MGGGVSSVGGGGGGAPRGRSSTCEQRDNDPILTQNKIVRPQWLGTSSGNDVLVTVQTSASIQKYQAAR